jgi:hypothetical protein
LESFIRITIRELEKSFGDWKIIYIADTLSFDPRFKIEPQARYVLIPLLTSRDLSALDKMLDDLWASRHQ